MNRTDEVLEDTELKIMGLFREDLNYWVPAPRYFRNIEVEQLELLFYMRGLTNNWKKLQENKFSFSKKKFVYVIFS